MIRLGILVIRWGLQRYSLLSSISIQVLTDVKLNENEPRSVVFFLKTLRIDDHLNLLHDKIIIKLLAKRTDVLRIAELEALTVGAEKVVGSVKSSKASWLMKVSNVSPFDHFVFSFQKRSAEKQPSGERYHRSDFMVIKRVQDSKEGLNPNLEGLSGGYINMTQRRFIQISTVTLQKNLNKAKSKLESRKSINRKIVELLKREIWPFKDLETSKLIKEYVKNQQRTIASQFKERGQYDKIMINDLGKYIRELPFVLLAIQNVKSNSCYKTVSSQLRGS